MGFSFYASQGSLTKKGTAAAITINKAYVAYQNICFWIPENGF